MIPVKGREQSVVRNAAVNTDKPVTNATVREKPPAVYAEKPEGVCIVAETDL